MKNLSQAHLILTSFPYEKLLLQTGQMTILETFGQDNFGNTFPCHNFHFFQNVSFTKSEEVFEFEEAE